MGRKFCHVYLILHVCQVFISLLYKVQNKCLLYINQDYSKEVAVVTFDDQVVDKVCKKINHFLIEENHFKDKNINIVVMSSQCHIKKALVNKTLKAKYHLTFSYYLRKKRIGYACELLLDPSNMKIDVIADASGFKTTRTFVRNFKEINKMSPTEFRKLQALKKQMIVEKEYFSVLTHDKNGFVPYVY